MMVDKLVCSTKASREKAVIDREDRLERDTKLLGEKQKNGRPTQKIIHERNRGLSLSCVWNSRKCY